MLLSLDIGWFVLFLYIKTHDLLSVSAVTHSKWSVMDMMNDTNYKLENLRYVSLLETFVVIQDTQGILYYLCTAMFVKDDFNVCRFDVQ